MTKEAALAIGRALQLHPCPQAYLHARIADELMKAAVPHECRWSLLDWDSDAYDTSCGKTFCFEAETVEEAIRAGIIYCPYCAGRIVPTEAEWQIREREEREAEEVEEARAAAEGAEAGGDEGGLSEYAV